MAFFGMMLENAGIPVPAETTLITLAFFAGQGILKIWLLIPIAILGDVAGDNIGYAIGRLGGRPLVERYGRYIRLDRDKLDAMDRLFREKGGRTVYSAHFFSTTRITAALIAGISHMKYRRFLAFNAAAATTFVTAVAMLTYLFGRNLDTALHYFAIYSWVALSVVVLVIAWFLFRYYRKNRECYRYLGVKIVAGVVVALIAFLILRYLYLTRLAERFHR
ncbi:MAG: DedA family protein [Thermoleophilia bacterium]